MRPKSSLTLKLLLSLVAGISMMSMDAATAVFAATTVNLPDYSAPVLTPESQAATAWTNTIPNALADYYTYVPYSNDDAVKLGFPSTCGNTTLTGSPVDVGSTADCYTISVRQFVQPTSLDFLKYVGIPGFPGAGLIQADGVTPFSSTTDSSNPSGFLGSVAAGNLTSAWGYGSGGTGWMPNYPAGPVVTGNAPLPFRAVPFAALFGSSYNGDATATGVWHFPAPTIKGTSGRPVYVQWINDLPNVKPQGHDPSVDCGTFAKFCYPFNRIVTHVHGAHVTPESDGLAVAWYTPDFALFGEGKFADNLYSGTPGKPIYRYPMTQEAGTIWYHDHAVGTTHTNTNNGMAGFFPITDANEQARITEGTLPNPIFDNGFALQDRTFSTKAQMVMPDYATYDRTTPGCIIDAVTNLADPNTCTRLQWAKVLTADTVSKTNLTPVTKFVPMTSPEGIAATTVGNASYALNFPAGSTVDLKNSFEGITLAGKPFTQSAPFPATSATLEYFGNMPVVNGVTYGNFNLEARVQRMRFIGGNDSRTWIMQIVKKGAVGTPSDCGTPAIAGGCMVYNPADIIPFFQIGSEQGLLDKPVRRDSIDLMDGERVDVLVDFTGVDPGSQFILKNLGDDAPYSGAFDFANLATRQPTSVDIPEIMQFTVAAADFVAKPNSARPSVLATSPGTPLRPQTPLVYPVPTAGEPVRTVSLIEITDQYGRTMPTIDARGFIPPGMMTTEYIKQNNTEYWDIVNTTVDAHPMHIHQVAFRALYRQAIASFDPPYSNTITKVFSQPTYHAGANLPISVDTWDAGWKDTIQSIPGTVVRVIATWDLTGEYVWHCHILSHEEHDMMRPFMVVSASTAAAPKKLTASVNNNQGTITLSWPAVTGATGYVIHESTNNFTTSIYAVTTGPVVQAVLKNKADGTYTYRISAILGSAQTGFTACTSPVIVAKTVAAPASVKVPTINDNGLVPVTWAASSTPSFFESVTGSLYYPVQYMVTYDVTATLTTAPFTAYTTTGFSGVGTTFSATIGQTPDPVTGAVVPLPDGIYTITVVANLASWKPSIAKAGVNAVAVSRVAQPVAKVSAAIVAGKTIKVTWPLSATVGASYTVFQNSVQVATGLTGTTYTTGALTNGIYIMSVRADRAGLTGSATVAAAPVTINVTNVAPSSLTATKNGTTGVILSWPTIAGATMKITQNLTVISPTITTQGLLSVVSLTGLAPGTYAFTIQNTTTGANPSKVVNSTPKSIKI